MNEPTEVFFKGVGEKWEEWRKRLIQQNKASAEAEYGRVVPSVSKEDLSRSAFVELLERALDRARKGEEPYGIISSLMISPAGLIYRDRVDREEKRGRRTSWGT